MLICLTRTIVLPACLSAEAEQACDWRLKAVPSESLSVAGDESVGENSGMQQSTESSMTFNGWGSSHQQQNSATSPLRGPFSPTGQISPKPPSPPQHPPTGATWSQQTGFQAQSSPPAQGQTPAGNPLCTFADFGKATRASLRCGIVVNLQATADVGKTVDDLQYGPQQMVGNQLTISSLFLFLPNQTDSIGHAG